MAQSHSGPAAEVRSTLQPAPVVSYLNALPPLLCSQTAGPLEPASRTHPSTPVSPLMFPQASAPGE